MEIKNVIFDLGVVLLDLDIQETIHALEMLSNQEICSDFFSQATQLDCFRQYDRGEISDETFLKELNSVLQNPKLTQKQLIDAWNAMLLGIPFERIELLKRARQKYRIFLLSNTNHLHVLAINEYLKTEHPSLNFWGLFEKVYFSYEMGMRKPERRIFEYVLRKNNLLPQETLFIDDTKQHIDTATQLGIQCLWLQKHEDLFSKI